MCECTQVDTHVFARTDIGEHFLEYRHYYVRVFLVCVALVNAILGWLSPILPPSATWLAIPAWLLGKSHYNWLLSNCKGPCWWSPRQSGPTKWSILGMGTKITKHTCPKRMQTLLFDSHRLGVSSPVGAFFLFFFLPVLGHRSPQWGGAAWSLDGQTQSNRGSGHWFFIWGVTSGRARKAFLWHYPNYDCHISRTGQGQEGSCLGFPLWQNQGNGFRATNSLQGMQGLYGAICTLQEEGLASGQPKAQASPSPPSLPSFVPLKSQGLKGGEPNATCFSFHYPKLAFCAK